MTPGGKKGAAAPPLVTIEPGMFDEHRTGEFLGGRSTAWLRAMRQEDIARMKRGEAPRGPAWIVINRSVFYRPDDLRRWIAENAVVRGVVSFDKRVGAVSALSVPQEDGA